MYAAIAPRHSLFIHSDVPRPPQPPNSQLPRPLINACRAIPTGRGVSARPKLLAPTRRQPPPHLERQILGPAGALEAQLGARHRPSATRRAGRSGVGVGSARGERSSRLGQGVAEPHHEVPSESVVVGWACGFVVVGWRAGCVGGTGSVEPGVAARGFGGRGQQRAWFAAGCGFALCEVDDRDRPPLVVGLRGMFVIRVFVALRAQHIVGLSRGLKDFIWQALPSLCIGA